MSMHLHDARQWMAWGLVLVALSPFALCFGSSTPEFRRSDVSGRVTYSGKPVSDMIFCLDSGGQHAAYGLLKSDGTFRLLDISWGERGAQPGHYHAHIYNSGQGPIPTKYAHTDTSGIEVEIASGWNEFNIDLQ
jgi:hypothetical protein